MTGRFGRPRGSPVTPPPQSAGHRAGLPARLSRALRSVAGQVFVLQAVIVVLLITAATLALVYQARYDSERDARDRSLAAAEAFAHAPGLPQALKAPNPTTVLQPLAESARRA
ncbi:histidine kinase, partial [Streptomyces goshikiensis]